MSDFPFLAAVIDVAISGSEVPRAIMVKPTNESDMFSICEISIAESTVRSAPKSVIIIEKTTTSVPNFTGFLYEILEKKSFSILISSRLSEFEF